MNPPPSSRDGEGKSSGSSDKSPGVPGFRSWTGVYWFVFASFVVVVVALALFSRAFG